MSKQRMVTILSAVIYGSFVGLFISLGYKFTGIVSIIFYTLAFFGLTTWAASLINPLIFIDEEEHDGEE